MKSRTLLTLAFASTLLGLAVAAEPAAPAIKVGVYGAVATPGLVTLTDKQNLLDAVGAAGGFTRLAEKRAVVISKTGEMNTYDLSQTVMGRSPDTALHDGDIITFTQKSLPVPDASVQAGAPITVTMSGEVANPGPLKLLPEQSFTLPNAINAAGSFTRNAAPRFIVIKSKNGEQKMADMSAPTARDLTLHDGDAIFVPDNRQSPPELPIDPKNF